MKRLNFITKVLVVLALIAAPVLTAISTHSEVVSNRTLITLAPEVAEAVGSADFTYVNPNAQIAFLQALAALPGASGGTLQVLSTGTVDFAAAITSTKANVTVIGASLGTAFTFNGVNPPFIVVHNGWTFINCTFDVAPNMGATTNWSWSNVTAAGVHYDYRNSAYSVIGGAVVATSVAGGAVSGTSVTDSGLTSGRVTYAGAGGLLTNEAGFEYNAGTNVLSSPTVTATTLNAPTGRTATYVIAASNATALEKAQADYVCDGTADNVEIQAAITSLATSGGIVQLSTGTFTLAAQINIRDDNLVLRGSGLATKLDQQFAGVGIELRKVAGLLSNIELSDFYFDGNTLTYGVNNSPIFMLNGVGDTFDNIRIHDIKIEYAQNCGILVCPVGVVANVASNIHLYNLNITDSAYANIGFGRTLYSTIENCYLARSNNTWANLDLNSNNHILVQNVVGVSSAGHNISNDSGSYITIKNCKSINSGVCGIWFQANGACSNILDHVVIENNDVLTTVTNSGIVVYGGSNSIKILNNKIDSSYSSSIFVSHNIAIPSDIEISGNTITNFGLWVAEIIAAIRVLGEAGNIITNVKITNNSINTGTVNDDAIEIDYVSRVQINNNRLSNIDRFAFIAQNSSTIRFTDNILYLCGINPTILTSTDVVVEGNVGYIAPGEVRTASGSLVPTGVATATTVTGTFTESPLALKPGANIMHCTVNGTANIVMPAGSIAVVTSIGGGATVTDSPKTCPAGATTLITVTAGGTNDFTITVHSNAFAWHDPELQDILIKKIVINRTAAGGTATAEMNVGIADNGTVATPGTEFFNNMLVNNAAAIHDSYVAGGTSYGTQTIWVNCQDFVSATGGWVVGKLDTEIANSLAGTWYIEYTGK